MKKRIFLLTAVAVIALFTLCACGNQNTNTPPTTPNQSTGQTEQNNDDNKKPNSESENTTTATDGTYSKSRSQTIKEAIDSEMSGRSGNLGHGKRRYGLYRLGYCFRGQHR